ncbi:DNA-directed RNA polymerase subunit beta [Cytobacillus purgationiresistens]|uniref:DNA-directed RNA polymerase subunit beta n=1 Tax=Cytobacillus purgationiresistens TaxID=863449 RepID=A0ABU0AD96_9BACI|nr:DNA-directed RNA polymerase subunit beta [Cytobacillus purgationiresistens]MDQ0269230.1 hypothetical protein [Cytobacillus purgationiresistens]
MSHNKNNKQEEAPTMIQKQNKVKERSRETEANSHKERIRIRLIPIWLRIIIIIVLIALCLVGGAAFGYSVLGEGSVKDIFSKETWTHIIDLVNKE